MPPRPSAPVASSSRHAKRIIESASPDSPPPPSSTRTRGAKRVVATYVEDEEDDDEEEDEEEDEDELDNDIEDGGDDVEDEEEDGEEEMEEQDEDDAEGDYEDSMVIDSPAPAPAPNRNLRVTLRVPPKPRTSSGSTTTNKAAKFSPAIVSKRSVSKGKKVKIEEPPRAEQAELVDEEGEEDDDEARLGISGKMTARQRAKGNKDILENLLVLEEAPSTRALVLTEQEKLERKEEASRRRRRQVEQKLQDEQDETINRLLRAQTSRSRSKIDAADLDGEPSANPSPSRRTAMLPEGMVRWTSSLTPDGNVVMKVGAPKGKEDWLDLVAVELNGGETSQVLGKRKGRGCNAPGCEEQRKYRSVKEFEMGGCCMEHLKVVESSL